MSVDYSISLNGINSAEFSLNQAARRIASIGLPSGDDSADSLSLSDIAAELIAIDQAKTAVKANLKVITTGQELDREALDLFA